MPSPTAEAIPVVVIPTPTPTAVPVSILKVVYASNGNIRLWDGTGTKQLTGSTLDSNPKISDDGAVVAFMRNDELWAVNVDGTNERTLVSAGDLAALPSASGGRLELRSFDFAPNSHDIYFNTNLVGDPFSWPEYSLARVNADNPALRVLLNSDQGGAEFTFSPTGTKIALVRNNKIDIVNADGNGLDTVLTFLPVMMYSETSYFPQIVWLPDGSGFTTAIPAPDGLGDPFAPTRFIFVPADGSQAAQVAQFVAGPAFANRPYISPDASRVLYVKPQGANLEVHVIDASTTDLTYFSRPASGFGILGWAVDSIGVIFWIDDPRRTWLVSLSSPAAPLSDVDFADRVTWVDVNNYLFMNESELRLRSPERPSVLIDSGVKDGFDFWRDD